MSEQVPRDPVRRSVGTAAATAGGQGPDLRSRNMARQLTRRQFSRGVLATGAWAAAAVRSSARGSFGANEKIRAAVIGCRTRGPQLAKNIVRTGHLELAALCDCDDEVIADALRRISESVPLPSQLRTVKDFRNVIDDKSIDAVFIAVPDHWHAIITIMALQAGKHVYIEKPASYNINEGKAMAAAQRRYPRQTVLVGTQQRSARHFAEAKQFVDSRALGRIGFARAWITNDKGALPRVPDSDPPASLDYDLWLGPAPYRPYNKYRVHYNWHFMRDTGTGYIANWGAHWLDVVRWFLGVDLPDAVSSHGVKLIDDIKEWPDTHTVLFEYLGLTVLWEQRIWTEYALNGKPCGVEFHGDRGAMFIDRRGWTFYPKGTEGQAIFHPGREEFMSLRHVEHFADCIRGESKPVSGIDEGHRTAILCHLGNIAATVHRRLEFDAGNQEIKRDPEAAGHMSRPYRKGYELPEI